MALESTLTKLLQLSIGVTFPGQNFVWKFHASEYDPVGIPDIVGHILGRFVGLECKMQGNSFSTAQVMKIRLMCQSGGFACGIFQMNDNTVWLIPVEVIGKFTIKDRTGWYPLPRKPWRDHTGKVHEVLDLTAIRVLLESSSA